MFDSSHREEFNLAVLHAFVCMQELQDMLIVSALRQFLWSFRLPGEAQKIDRMMEKFAERYCELNPDIFTTTGADNRSQQPFILSVPFWEWINYCTYISSFHHQF